MEIHAGLEHIGITRQGKSSQVAAVRPSPDRDAPRVDAICMLQIARPGQHVLVFRRTRGAGMGRMLEGPPVADTQPVVHRQHGKAVQCQVLVHGISVAVIVHVMPAQQHLPRRAAVNKDDSRLCSACTWGAKQLPLDGKTVGRGEAHQPGRDQRLRWIALRAAGIEHAAFTTGHQYGHCCRLLCPGSDIGNAALRKRSRRPLQRATVGERPRRLPVCGDAKQVAPGFIVFGRPGVCAVDQAAVIRGLDHVLHHEAARG